MPRDERPFAFDDDDLEPVGACNLCGGRRFTAVSRSDRYALEVTTVLCEGCGLVFLDPRPSAAAYRRFYRDAYRPLVERYTGRRSDPAGLEADQRTYARKLDRRLIRPRLHGGERTLLDVGASTGVVAEHFARRYGLRATCVEPAPAEAAAARRRGLEVAECQVEDFDPGPRRFDVVLLCQTVDHLLDVGGVLARIHDWLADDGLFFVDAVDFRAVLRSLHRLSAALHADHPYYLTRETMDLYLRRAGFEVVALNVSTVFHLDYVCRKAAPQPIAADPGFARALYDEIRWVQATHQLGTKPSGPPPGALRRLRRRLAGLLRRSDRP
ncbi:MAG: class I SAM-dependent methyltransferase [Acidobacteria bacterium]|nr:MAG: class I SAM-dependent methyltransferase [Acidobacteriota bacterium]